MTTRPGPVTEGSCRVKCGSLVSFWSLDSGVDDGGRGESRGVKELE